ncbi:MAG: Hsp20/alpha crystallin family protein [Candidatus Omnitrophica bacterium]|nr:Hsp20/alpha crystallin family protein [Candidatus Omnitrophota bacterium]
MEQPIPNSKNNSENNKMPKWAAAIIALLSLLVVVQFIALTMHYMAKKEPAPVTAMQQSPFDMISPHASPAGTQDRMAHHPFTKSQAFTDDPFFDDAFSSMSRLSQHMNRLFAGMADSAFSQLGSMGSFMPDVDIEETPESYVVKSDLPGLEKDKINIHVQGNLLTLQGVRQSERESKNDGNGFYAQERSYGSFARTINLPGPVDENGIKAAYDNGVLTVTLPKKNGAATSKITVE